MTVGLEELYRAIGSLDAKVSILIEHQRASDAESKTSRERATIAAEETARRFQELEHQMQSVLHDVESIRPFAEKVRDWEQRGIGALAAAGMIGGSVGAAVGGALVYFKDALIARLFGGG